MIYLRFFSMTLLVALATVCTLAGGWMMWLGFAIAVFVAVGGDQFLGDDLSEPDYRHTWILNAQLFSSLPMLWLNAIAFAWHLGFWNGADLFGIGALASSVSLDLFAAREATTWYHLLGGGLGMGMMFGGVGTVVGHELTHRTWSKPAMITGRWLLALTSDASFAIEHVYGHHFNVATRQDPATSRRGENAWFFVVRSTIQSYISAWKIEASRLQKKRQGLWSWHNKMLRGNLMTVCYAAFFAWAAGWQGAATFMLVSLYGKAYLEFVNYVEHYGMVRVPGAPVEPRHSWNCNRRVSSVLLYNLTRHSHHHAMGEKPFWELKAYPDTPMMPYGYLTMIWIAAIPPLWNRIMIPRVLEWDRTYASPEEQPYIEEANRLSGHPGFMQAESSRPPAQVVAQAS